MTTNYKVQFECLKTQTRKVFYKNTILNAIIIAAVFILPMSKLFAANQTWSNTGIVSGNWSEITNWGGNIAPGATSGNTTTDVATFNTAAGTYGTSANPIVIDGYRNISNITFNATAGNYTIGSTSGNVLHMTSGGNISIASGLATNNTTITINASLLMYGDIRINNQALNVTNRFLIGGNISSATSGAKTLVLQSVSANNRNINDITGLISDGAAGSVVSVTQSTSGGIWRLLNDANSFTGNLSIGGGSVYVISIGNQGVASAAGAGTTINIGGSTSTGNLYFTGTGQTTNRTINMAGTTGGANIYANNASGLLKFTSNFTATGAGSKTLTLRGTGAGGAEVAGVIVNNSSTNVTSVLKNDTGTWTLSGNNTFTGTLTIQNGTLSINSIGDVGQASNAGAGSTIRLGNSSIPATLLYTGTGHTTNKTVDLTGRSTTLTINASGSGLLKFTNNFTSTGLGNKTLALSGSGSGEIAGAIVDATSGSVWLNSDAANGTTSLSLASTIGIITPVLVSASANITAGTTIASISGSTATLSNATTGTLTSGSTVLTIDGVRNPTSVTKNDAGTWTLSASNTYTGNTTVNAGVLIVANNNALGTAAGGTIVVSNAALHLQGDITIADEALMLSGGGISNAGALRSVSGDNTWTGNITIGSVNTRIASNSGLLTISGGISAASGNSTLFQGNGNVTVSGIISGAGSVSTSSSFGATSVLTLSNDNTFTGQMSINKGIVSVSSIKNFGIASGLGAATSSVIVIGQTGSNGTLVYTGAGDTSNRTFQIGTNGGTPSAADTGSATIQNNGSGALVFNATNFNTATNATTGVGANRTLTLGGSNTDNNIISGVIRDNAVSGSATGTATIGLIKSGSGTWILSGNNTYTGSTTINGGILHASTANALGNTTKIDINGGSLLMSVSQNKNSTNITLNGGTLAFSGTTTNNFGVLTLTADSSIDFGTESVFAYFSDIRGLDQYRLKVFNWTSVPLFEGGFGGGTDRIVSRTSLSSSELQRISFYSGLSESSFTGSGFQIMGSSFDGEVIGTPEPGTYVIAILLIGGLAVHCFKRNSLSSLKSQSNIKL